MTSRVRCCRKRCTLSCGDREFLDRQLSLYAALGGWTCKALDPVQIGGRWFQVCDFILFYIDYRVFPAYVIQYAGGV